MLCALFLWCGSVRAEALCFLFRDVVSFCLKHVVFVFYPLRQPECGVAMRIFPRRNVAMFEHDRRAVSWADWRPTGDWALGSVLRVKACVAFALEFPRILSTCRFCLGVPQDVSWFCALSLLSLCVTPRCAWWWLSDEDKPCTQPKLMFI